MAGKKTRSGKYTKQDAPVNYEKPVTETVDSSNIEENSEVTKVEIKDAGVIVEEQVKPVMIIRTSDSSTPVQNRNNGKDTTSKVEAIKQEKPEEFYTSLVRYRAIGVPKINGKYHMGRLIDIVNLVVKNDGSYTVLVSQITAKNIARIIREEDEKLAIGNMSMERKEVCIKRLFKDLKTYRF